MAKQIKVKDIAQMAGISAGTVDRVLHKRGNVSDKSREAVEKVLAQVGYKYNIHTSAISYRKKIKFVITIPEAEEGEYWGAIRNGLNHALEEFSDIETECNFLFYDQFNVDSCTHAFSQVLDSRPDAVIIGPTYIDETINLCSHLDNASIPYIFIDSNIEGTYPLATFSCNQTACGELAAKLLCMSTTSEGSIAIFNAERIGRRLAHNSIERRKGFESFMKANGLMDRLKRANYSISNSSENKKHMLEFLQSNPDIKGIAVLNSRGHIIADTLKECGRNDIHVLSFDLTANNIRCLNNGRISVLLCQRPEQQGFNSIKTMINHLLYKNIEDGMVHIMPIDIIFKENLPYYSEL